MKLIEHRDHLEDFQLESILAVDVEGVDLGRKGIVSLVQIANSIETYVFDVLGKTRTDPVILFLKNVFENKNIVKIFHDCRMDSDALFYHYDIRLANVHDTQCWHELSNNQIEASLNTVLGHNNIPINEHRNTSIYLIDYEFWQHRPLTETMLKWAEGDVQSLISIYRHQIKHNINGSTASERYSTLTMEMSVFDIEIEHVGNFIGKHGKNIKKLKQDTGTLIYPFGPRFKKTFRIYYKTLLDLQLFIDSIKIYKCNQTSHQIE